MFLKHVSFFASIAEAVVVIPSQTKIFFAKESAAFINGPTNLLKKYPKNPPGWIIFKKSGFRKFYVSWHIVIKCIS